jgi:hypothetical protein
MVAETKRRAFVGPFFCAQKQEGLVKSIFLSARKVEREVNRTLTFFVESGEVVHANAVSQIIFAEINAKSQLVIIDCGPRFAASFNNAVDSVVSENGGNYFV